jgi:hypothetical protein
VSFRFELAPIDIQLMEILAVDVVNSIKPSPLPKHTFPTGFPEITAGEKVHLLKYDTKKEKELFGIKLRTQLETARDTLEDFAKRGW